MRISVLAALLAACTAFDDLKYPLERPVDESLDASVDAEAPMTPKDAAAPCTRENAGRCYFFNANRISWTAAEDACQAWGGHLVSVRSEAELEFLRQLVADEEKATPASTGIWIGLDSRGTPGVWNWTDGTPVDFTHWATNEPDTATPPKECVYQYGLQYDGHWDNFLCTVAAESVCAR
jgi:hypothetical protein